MSKTPGWVTIDPLPCTTVGVSICVYVRVLIAIKLCLALKKKKKRKKKERNFKALGREEGVGGGRGRENTPLVSFDATQ